MEFRWLGHVLRRDGDGTKKVGWMDDRWVDGWMIDVSTEKSTFCIISCPFTLEQSGVSAEGRLGDIDSHSFSLR